MIRVARATGTAVTYCSRADGLRPRQKEKPLTAKQRVVLEYIIGFYFIEGYTPSLSHMALELKMSVSSARQHLSALTFKRYLSPSIASGGRTVYEVRRNVDGSEFKVETERS